MPVPFLFLFCSRLAFALHGGSLAVAIFHLSTKPISRSAGRSAVAAAAYRTKSVLLDERQGLLHDYTKRSGVPFEKLVLPEGVDEAHWTRERLWNTAEFAEVRKDARTAREWEVALPEELSAEDRKALAVGFARELAQRYGCAVDVGIHTPGKGGDRRNHHAHLLATTRVVLGSALGEKTVIELSDAKRLSLGLGQGRQEIEQVRALWAERTNQALAKQEVEARIDHRSLAVQHGEALTAGDIIRAAAFDRMPETKLGWKASAMERRGVETERGDQLRAVKQENGLRQNFNRQVGKLKALLARIVTEAEAARQRVEARKRDEEKRQRQAMLQQERREAARQHEFREYVARLWAGSPAGRSEAATLEKRRQDLDLEAQYAGRLEQARAVLAQWKQDHPVKSRFFEATVLEDQAREAWAVHARHTLQMPETEKKLRELAKEREAVLPQLKKQAAADLQQVTVKLTPEQVKLLLDEVYGRDREASRKAFTQIEQRTHAVRILDGAVDLQRFEQEGFGAILRRKDRDLLDQQLATLHIRQRWAAKQQERERSRGKQQDHGYERD